MSSRFDSKQLNTDELLKLHAAVGRQIVVVKGLVWITQERDPRDIFLGAGGTLTLDRRGMALVQAVRDTALLVSAPVKANSPIKTISIAVRRGARSLWRNLGPTAVAQTVRPQRASAFSR